VGVPHALVAAFCGLLLPRVTRWAFAGVGQHRGARFLIVLVALTSAALVADRAGIEGIVGAFFAGVVLVTVLASSLITRSAARRIDPPPVQGERLAENVFVPVDVVDDPAVVRLAGPRG
jgi:Kef-type K+ transport system membrane component KefB